MSAIITTNTRVFAALQFMSGFSNVDQALYLFIGRTLPWDDDNSPPAPVDSESVQSDAFIDMMSLKKITSTDVSLVIPRNNWTANTVYSQYVNDIDLFDPASEAPPFFVVTNQMNVYKCLDNFNGSPSTVKPTGTSNFVVTLGDNYRWKYMYTVGSSDIITFVTNLWIPVETLTVDNTTTQWLVQQAAVPGTIDRIELLTGGIHYTTNPTVTIVGNGTGATATAVAAGGAVTSVTITSNGTGYTWAQIVFTGGGVSATGATAKAVISPFSGHGADAARELGGFRVLIDSQLIYDESTTFTVKNDYRRIGILNNPLLNDGVTSAVGNHYNQSLRLTFSSVNLNFFQPDETVTGGTSGATGVVLDYDTVNLVLRLVQTVGTFIPGESVTGAISTASGVLQTITGAVVSGTTSTVVLPNTASSTNSAYTGQTIRISAGTGSGQTSVISGYIGSTRTATVSPVFSVAPNSTSTFIIASIILPDLKPFTGDILYLENRRPISRDPTQIENSRTVIEF